jgi:hypothetical protein
MLLAPGASSSTPVSFPGPGSNSRLPRLDDSLLPEDSCYEILDGRRIHCMGEREHARPHAQLAYVIAGLAAPGFEALVELTTRADTAPPPADLDPTAERLPSTVQELRPDASILRQGTDPATGDRYIEDLSFEVVNTQSMSNVRGKAQRLVARGVRRVFAIFVKKGQVMEWSAKSGEFLPVVGEIRDPSLRMPLSVQALLQATDADDAVARALLAKGNPVLTRLRAEERREGEVAGRREGEIAGRREGEVAGRREGEIAGRREGEVAGRREGEIAGRREGEIAGRREGEEGLRQALEALCAVLDIELTEARRAVLEKATLADLRGLVQAIKVQRRWPSH